MGKYDHIHFVGDGKGKRKIELDGKEIDFVTYADTEKGIVVYHPHPIEIKPNGDIRSRTLRGKVTVEFLEGDR